MIGPDRKFAPKKLDRINLHPREIYIGIPLRESQHHLPKPAPEVEDAISFFGVEQFSSVVNRFCRCGIVPRAPGEPKDEHVPNYYCRTEEEQADERNRGQTLELDQLHPWTRSSCFLFEKDFLLSN